MNYCFSTSKWLHEHTTLLRYKQMTYPGFFVVYSTTVSFNKCRERHTVGWLCSNDLRSTQKKTSVVRILSGNLCEGTEESHTKLYSG